uniref:Terpene synthase N-terminal domain-containing protein n=1 Tax=Nelumbo nucifera TaxID=4432 RepID=A0A822XRD8_NELNU|nr:TPA_asm: hypothetical protein HUJ06_024453 [Nelumbo nucifera]
MVMEAKSCIHELIKTIKEEMFPSSVDIYNLISPSAYDTAWLIMIPDPQRPDRPMFQDCLNWILSNQNDQGFWGDYNNHDAPRIDCLPATLACVVALCRWNVGINNVHRGMTFIHANGEKLITELRDHYPRWFAIIFPAMVELARATQLEVIFDDGLERVVEDVFSERQRILETEGLVDQLTYLPLMSYLEALPPSYDINEELILKHLSEDGSIFQSPSATAFAFMATGDERCKLYLESLVRRCGKQGIEELIKLCIVNQLEHMGLAEYYLEEIEDILAHAYRSYMDEGPQDMVVKALPIQIYKDSLVFRLLRMHGYMLLPGRLCWFLNREDVLVHIEENYEYFLDAMFNVYKATDVMFLGENELEEPRIDGHIASLLSLSIPQQNTDRSMMKLEFKQY